MEEYQKAKLAWAELDARIRALRLKLYGTDSISDGYSDVITDKDRHEHE